MAQWSETIKTNFNKFSKVSAIHDVVCLNKNLSQSTLPNRVVLGIELIKPVEGVAILEKQCTLKMSIIHDANDNEEMRA